MFENFPPFDDQITPIQLINNIMYLEEHGLLRRLDFHGKPVPFYDLSGADKDFYIATAKGIDFIQQDGGLSAILGVVTVKLHSDTIQALLAAKIDEAKISQEEKNRLKAALGKVGDAVLATLTEKTINAIPAAAAVALIQSVLNQ